jgi:thymidylate synthase
VPYDELIAAIAAGKEEFSATMWPYAYHQRLSAYPRPNGVKIDQLEVCLNKLAKDPISRRSVAITAVPEIDLFMKADMPCLREIQLRAPRGEDGKLRLNMHATWRSRDDYKAWGDNVIGITNLQASLACRLSEKVGEPVLVGPYTEANGSLHIYGQDYTQKGMDTFFQNFPTVESFMARAKTSEEQLEGMILPELEELKAEETWHFPPESIAIIDGLIEGYKSGKFVP